MGRQPDREKMWRHHSTRQKQNSADEKQVLRFAQDDKEWGEEK